MSVEIILLIIWFVGACLSHVFIAYWQAAHAYGTIGNIDELAYLLAWFWPLALPCALLVCAIMYPLQFLCWVGRSIEKAAEKRRDRKEEERRLRRRNEELEDRAWRR